MPPRVAPRPTVLDWLALTLASGAVCVLLVLTVFATANAGGVVGFVGALAVGFSMSAWTGMRLACTGGRRGGLVVMWAFVLLFMLASMVTVLFLVLAPTFLVLLVAAVIVQLRFRRRWPRQAEMA